MNDDIPKSKWRRGLTGGKTAIKVGGHATRYFVKKTILSEEAKEKAKDEFSRNSAQALFEGLSLLRGTALKIAQMLSLELDLFPDSVRKELEKSFNQVPAINRALVRKIISSALGGPPEQVFQSFDSTAFAAASLGQVHLATARNGKRLAVKVQYPGMRETIQNDLQLVRTMVKPFPEYRSLSYAFDEIEARLLEETDYIHEANNLEFFKKHLKIPGVVIPDLFPETSERTVLSLSFLEGLPLHQWLETGPDQEARNQVAQRLREIFLFNLYELNCIHADPNPGNFIIGPDNRVGLVDYGCVKRFDPQFVAMLRQLASIAVSGDTDGYFRMMRLMKAVREDLPPEVERPIKSVIDRACPWVAQLYLSERFDFRQAGEFIALGKSIMNEFAKIRDEVDLVPDMLFLNRSMYGLIRVYEMLGAQVIYRNTYEWDG